MFMHMTLIIVSLLSDVKKCNIPLTEWISGAFCFMILEELS